MRLPAAIRTSGLVTPFRAWLGAAIGLGILVRGYHVLRFSFPLNDGGLFFTMVRDLQANDYRLPETTTYNGGGIPFGYPPFALYLSGLVDDLTPLDLFDVFRLLPLIGAIATIFAFTLLARSFVTSRVALVAAVFAFAAVPRSFIWLLMGGGVTRSFGLLFALLALHQVHRLYTTRSYRYLPVATLLSALTVLSHLETGWFLAFSIAVFVIAFGRHQQGILSSAFLAIGTVILTAPWWATVLAYHGLDPFQAAQGTGGSIFDDGATRTYIALSLLRGVATSEPLFPLIGVLALVGALWAIAARQFFLPAWWASIILLDARAFPTFTTVPVAMLAGLGVAYVVLPLLAGGHIATASEAPLPRLADFPRRSLAVGGVLGAYVVVAALLTNPGLNGEGSYLRPLTSDERAAMRWVNANAAPESSFLIIPRGSWETDRESEWFSVLASRRSVATVQGMEWILEPSFSTTVDRYEDAWDCGYETARCLDELVTERDITFTHVWVPRTAFGQCCDTLLTSLDDDPRYRVVFDQGGGTIYEVVGGLGLSPGESANTRDD